MSSRTIDFQFGRYTQPGRRSCVIAASLNKFQSSCLVHFRYLEPRISNGYRDSGDYVIHSELMLELSALADGYRKHSLIFCHDACNTQDMTKIGMVSLVV
jgi:hypothetical protein